MPLTILSDDDVQEVLDSLDKQDVLNMHKALADALHSYSTATEPADTGCCQSNQPKRLQIKLKGGATTLFMPSVSDDALGIKVVTLSEGSDKRGNISNLPVRASSESSRPNSPTAPASPINGGNHSPVPRSPGTPRSHSPSLRHSSTGGSSISSSTTLAHRSSTSTRSTASSEKTAAGPYSHLAQIPDDPSTTSPAGTLTLLSNTGQPRAVISAKTLTAFRTALASTLLLKNRKHCHTMTVFGAGRQAYWHIHLALLLRGSEIHHIHLINRTFDRAALLYKALGGQRNREIRNIFLGGKIRPEILTPEFGEYSRISADALKASDVIFCCTPSTTPLFSASCLTNSEARKKARYICAVGSYKPHMQEIPIELLHQAVRGPEDHHHGPFHHRTAGEGGAVVVDTIEGAMTEAGEIIRSGIGGRGVVELGELVMLKRSHWAEKAEREEQERKRREAEGQKKDSGGGHGLSHFFKDKRADSRNSSPAGGRARSGDRKRSGSRGAGNADVSVQISDGGLQEWLQRGNVIYKSVGIGLMDIVVGMAIVQIAEERGLGTTFENFS